MGAAIRRLDLSLIRVSGADRLTWLNGQITNDLLRNPMDRALYALALDVRGKIQADLWIYQRQDDLLVAVPPDQRAALLVHFDRFLVMEDAAIEPLDTLVVVAVEGTKPSSIHPSFAAQRLDEEGWDLLVPTADVDSLIERLERELGVSEVDDQRWETRRVEAARPRFGVDFGPDHYPQEAGLRDLAVSFHKGCYVGQEVVCMLENRGSLRRRLVQLEGPAGVPGGALVANDVVVGTLTSVVPGPRGVIALGYVKVDKSGAVVPTVTHEGQPFSVRGLVGAGHSEGVAL